MSARPPRRAALVALAIVTAALLLRLPAIVAPLGIDQGIYATAAAGLRRGLALYVDVWDHKPPGVHLTYLAGFALLGEHVTSVLVLDLLAAIVTLGALTWAGSRLTAGGDPSGGAPSGQKNETGGSPGASDPTRRPAQGRPERVERATSRNDGQPSREDRGRQGESGRPAPEREPRPAAVASAGPWQPERPHGRPGIGAFGWAVAALYAAATIPAARYGLGGFLERAAPEAFICAAVSLAAAAAVAWLRTRRPGAAFLMGLFVGVAVAYKPTAAVYWPAFVLWMVVESRRQGMPARGLRRAAVGSAAGAVVVPVIVVTWLWASHSLPEAWVALADYNRAYLATGPGWAAFLDLLAHDVWRRVKTDPLWLMGAIAGPVALRVWARGGRGATVAGLGVCWLAAATLAAAANGFRLYTTYFMPTLPPLAWLSVWFWTYGAGRIGRRRVRLGVHAALAVLALVVAHRGGFFVRGWQATTADLAVLSDPATRTSYLERYGGYGNGRGYSARANAELTEYLQRETTPSDRILIFGMQPGVYFTSGRRPASRFVWVGPVIFHLLPRAGFQMQALAADIERAPAHLVILERHYRDSQLGMTAESAFGDAEMVRALLRYDRVTEIEDFIVYKRRD